MNGLYVMNLDRFPDVYGPDERADIERHLRVAAPPVTAGDLTPGLLADVDVLVTAWGAPRLDAAFLDAAPKLALVLYGAGSVRSTVTPESWARGVRVTAAGHAIATAVAEFALAQILYALKHGWRYVLTSRATKAWAARDAEKGAFGSVVGLLSLGATGRTTADLLARHDVTVQAHDPFATFPDSVRSVGLEELFATSDVVSLHAPLLPQTRGLVGHDLLRSMKRDATLINTARGGLIDETALVEVLDERPDLFAVLDVTDPEPPTPGSPLFSLPNVVVTPHLAGSLGPERRRQGRLMAEELARYAAGRSLLHEVTEQRLGHSA
ncbi:hydroxyacid dehydrogenase [Nonomuraea insulae]|uniref:Hydroxyacid dehydrogenase n=1 Tax=Nonomuraea insulae TaxID=1616787 RepID=A0ABW1CSD3_9ACTN